MISPAILACAPAGGGPPAYTGPLDIVPGAVVAYSQRAMAAAWVSNAITIRRDSDDATQSFATNVSNAVDAAAISAFVGAGDGFASAWKDQSGNAIDIIQGTAAAQPQWAASSIGGKPGLTFARLASIFGSVASASITSGSVTFFIVTRSPDNSHDLGLLYLSVDNTTPYVQISLLRDVAGPAKLYMDAFDDTNEAGAETDIVFNVDTDYIFDGAWQFGLASTVLNGTDVPNTPFSFGDTLGAITGTINLATTVPGIVTRGLDGNIVEFLLYDGLLSAPNRLAIRQNIAAYYGIVLS